MSQFQTQLEGFQSDLEKFSSSKSKRQHKQEMVQLQQLEGRHQWHIKKLELINRMVDNDAIQPEAVDQVKEDVEYYLEANQEPDFMEVYGSEDIYEALALDSLGAPSLAVASAVKPEPVKVEEKPKETEAKLPVTNSIPVIGRGNLNTKSEPKKSPKNEQPTGTTPSITRQGSTASGSVVQQQQLPAAPKFKTSPRNTAATMPTVPTVQQPVVPVVHGTLSDEYRQVLRIVDASASTAPHNLDSERLKPPLIRNPYPTPVAYPSGQTPLFDNPALFEKFDTDTLFFIFYYQQGTYQQYLAARELKKQTWAYHKKYLTWFKRHEEPKVTCEEYEQGIYVYFDYETGWCQRIKSEFTFEYSYLEDELTFKQ